MKNFLLALAIANGTICVANPVTLRYVVMESGRSLASIQDVCKEFEKQNPDIRISLESVPTEFVQKILTQVAANVAPDVAQMSVNHYQAFATRGTLISIQELNDRFRTNENLKDRFPKSVQFFTTNGRTWAIPSSVSPFGLIFYNKKLFKKAGISEPPEDWTWDLVVRPELKEKDFVWVMQQLTVRDESGKVIQWGFAPEWPQLWFNLLLNSRGLSLWNSDEAPTQITADNQDVVELMVFANRLVNEERVIPTYDQISAGLQSSPLAEFKKGRIAMYTTFASYLDQLRTGIDANDFDWDIALFPSFKNQPRRFSADASGSVVFRKTRYPEQAWRFSRFISGKFAQSVLAKRNNLQPAIRSLSESSSVWLLPNSKPTNLAVTNVAANEMEYRQTPEYFEDTRIHLDNSVFDILNGTRPVRQTLATVTEQSQLRLDSALRRQPTRPYPWVLAIALGAIGCVFLAIWIVHPRSNHRSHLKDQSRTAIWFLLPTLVGLTCFTLGPMLYALMLSFGQSDMIRPTKWYGIGNYVDAITYDPLFWKSLQVTFVYALLSVPLNVAFSLVLAMFLNLKCYGIPVYRALFYLPSLASGVASSLVWMRIFHPEQGLLNQAIYGFGSEFGIGKFGSWLSQLAGNPVEPVNWLSNENTVLPAFVIMGLWGAGGGTIIFLAGLQAISTTYYEAASIDGASNLRKFYRITIPLLSPSIFFSLITGCIGSFQIFTQSYIMTQGGPNNATMFYLLNVYIQGFRSLKLGYASALAWILFVILLLLTIFQFRYAKKWVHYEGS